MLEKVCSLICARPLTLYAGGVLPDGKVLLHRSQHQRADDEHAWGEGRKDPHGRPEEEEEDDRPFAPHLSEGDSRAHHRTYMADGGGKKKVKKGKQAQSTERNADVWADLAQVEQ
jgi:hypothetical protein